MRMKINIKYTIYASVFLLCGCVVGPGWYKEGVNYEDSENVLEKCKYDIGIALVSSNERPELIAECMKSQGDRYKNYSHSY